MKNLGLAIGFFVAAFAVTAAYRRKKRPDRVMSLYELYNDNDVEFGGADKWLNKFRSIRSFSMTL